MNQRCAGDVSQVEIIMNNLLGRLVDQHATVRKLCVRGLGNIASLGSEQVRSSDWLYFVVSVKPGGLASV